MKRINGYFGFVLVVGMFVLFSCGTKPQSEIIDSDLTVIHFEEAPDTFRLTDAFSDIHVVQLEMTDESIVGMVKKIYDINGELFVQTYWNEIFVFSREDGKFLRTIGKIGEGPEEYLKAEVLYHDPVKDRLVVFDRGKGDLVTYGTDGTFTGRIKPPIFMYTVQDM